MVRDLLDYCRWFGDQIFDQLVGYDCLKSAASLTYTTLFAIVPIMAVGYRVLSLLPEFAGLGDQVADFVFRNFVPESSLNLQDQLSEFSSRALDLTWISFLVLVVTALVLLITIEKTFNGIWQVSTPRAGLSRFLTYWGVLTVGPPLVVASIIGGGYLLSLEFVMELDGAVGIDDLLVGWLPEIAAIATFTVIYYAVPNTYVPLRHAVLGGILTMLLFDLAKASFQLLVARMDTAVIYGTFAAVPLFLMWLYLVWVLVLVGAIFVRTLSLSRDVEVATPEPLVLKCIRVLKILHDAHCAGTTITNQEISESIRLTREEYDAIMKVLQEENLMQVTEDEHWILGKNLRGVTLWSLHAKFPEALDLERFEGVEGLEGVVERFKRFAGMGEEQLNVSVDEVFAA